jgi:hypothetical protein
VRVASVQPPFTPAAQTRPEILANHGNDSLVEPRGVNNERR